MVRVSLPFGAYQFALWQSKAIGMLEGMMLRYSRIVHLHIAVVHEGDLIRVSGRSGAMEGIPHRLLLLSSCEYCFPWTNSRCGPRDCCRLPSEVFKANTREYNLTDDMFRLASIEYDLRGACSSKCRAKRTYLEFADPTVWAALKIAIPQPHIASDYRPLMQNVLSKRRCYCRGTLSKARSDQTP